MEYFYTSAENIHISPNKLNKKNEETVSTNFYVLRSKNKV